MERRTGPARCARHEAEEYHLIQVARQAHEVAAIRGRHWVPRERIEQIAIDLMQMYKLEAIAIEHRVGEVPLNEPSVIVAISSRHRPAVFIAARDAIDKIKAEAPIWKLEVDAGYRSWVRGERPRFS